jgi:hypothetical protein
VDTPILDKEDPEDLPRPTLFTGRGREYFRHVQPRFYPADRLAQDIVRGIDRNSALVIAPRSARVASQLWRYAPVVVNQMTQRQLAWARAAFATPQAETATGPDPRPLPPLVDQR